MHFQIKHFLLLIACSAIFSGCGQKSFQGSLNNQRVLRIVAMYGDGYGDTYFRQQFTDAFELLNPDVKVEIVPAIDTSSILYGQQIREGNKNERESELDALKKIMEGPNAVDVVISDATLIRSLIKENRLQQLDANIKKDNFDIQELAPATINFMKEIGDGNIYGLAPTFSSQALFYNKKIFDNAGVEHPKDGMTWEDLFQIARRVANKKEGEEQIWGFQFYRYETASSPFMSLLSAVRPLELKVCDEKLEKMYMNTPGWKRAWNVLSKFYLEKVSPNPEDQGHASSNMKGDMMAVTENFLSGKVAMMCAEYSYARELVNMMKQAPKDPTIKQFDWDVVTPPVQADKPKESDSVSINTIFSINSKAVNPEDAWKYIQFINGEQWAHIKARGDFELVSRLKQVKAPEGININMKAFTSLSPVPITDSDFQYLCQKSAGLFKIQELGIAKFNEVISGKTSVEDALNQFQNKGTELLEKIRKDPNDVGYK